MANLFSTFLKRQLKKAMPFSPDEKLLHGSKLFDRRFYLEQNPDVKKAGLDPIKHYLAYGAADGRNPSANFDGSFYLQHYSDVALSGLNPLVHFLRFGQAEGRVALPPGATASDTDSSAASAWAIERALVEQSECFSAPFYLKTYPDVAAAKIDPLDHFMNQGWREGRRPHPNFDVAWYADQCPEVLTIKTNPVLHYLQYGKQRGYTSGPGVEVFEIARQMIAEAALIEPSIVLDDKLLQAEELHINYGSKATPVLLAWHKLFESLDKPFDYIVMTPWLVRGGADLVACNAIKAAIEKHGVDSTLLLLTDHDRREADHWLPPGTNVRVISDYDKSLSRSERAHIVKMLITAMRPKSVLNVNSGALWEATVGGALSRVTDIYACLFCRDYLPDGRAAGYSDTHFRDCLPYLKRVYCDNRAFLDELILDYGVPPSLQEKMLTLHQPISSSKENLHRGGPTTKNSVVWAGRFCAQKNIDLLIEIAEKGSDFEFEVYGYGDDELTKKLNAAASRLSNLRLMGPFTATSDLPFEQYNAFLFTSLWEGLPLTLADTAMTGIPIVASGVGGIPELVTAETGWCIKHYEVSDPYLAALREIKDNPVLAAQKGDAMRKHVLDTHSWSQYFSALAASPSFLD